VIDRVIQQAILQRLQPQWDPTIHDELIAFNDVGLRLRHCMVSGAARPEAEAVLVWELYPGAQGLAGERRRCTVRC
jgi:hypothetical protein